MKKFHLLFLSLLTFLMVGMSPAVKAQLNAGDLAVVYYNSINSDSITILTLVPLTAGEQFILTDQSVIDNPSEAFDTGSDAVTGNAAIYTTPAGGIPVYSLITYDQAAPSAEWTNYGASTTSTIMGNSVVNFNDFGGDQVFLFRDANTGNSTEPAAEPVFIFGIQYSPAGWTTSVLNGVAEEGSAEPAGLNAAGASLEITANDFGLIAHGQGVYTGPKIFSSPADALNEITNLSNWTTAVATGGKTAPIRTGSAAIHNVSNPFGPSTPALVPTMSEWGLIVLALLMLAMATIALMVSSGQLRTAGGASMRMFSPQSLPFELHSFVKILAMVLGSVIAIFAVAMLAFGYELTGADVPGTLIASPIAAYVLHLWTGGAEKF